MPYSTTIVLESWGVFRLRHKPNNSNPTTTDSLSFRVTCYNNKSSISYDTTGFELQMQMHKANAVSICKILGRRGTPNWGWVKRMQWFQLFIYLSEQKQLQILRSTLRSTSHCLARQTNPAAQSRHQLFHLLHSIRNSKTTPRDRQDFRTTNWWFNSKCQTRT